MLSWNMMPAAPTALFSPRRKYLSLQWWKPNTLASSQTKLMSNESFDSDNIQMSHKPQVETAVAGGGQCLSIIPFVSIVGSRHQ